MALRCPPPPKNVTVVLFYPASIASVQPGIQGKKPPLRKVYVKVFFPCLVGKKKQKMPGHKSKRRTSTRTRMFSTMVHALKDRRLPARPGGEAEPTRLEGSKGKVARGFLTRRKLMGDPRPRTTHNINSVVLKTCLKKKSDSCASPSPLP